MLRTITLAICVSAFTCQAKTARIAALYPTTTVGHINCSCGYEAACITTAVVERAKRNGLDVSLETIQTDRNVIGAMEAAKRVADEHFDVVVGTLVSSEAIPVAEILENAHIPFITPTATNPLVTKGKRFTARIPFNDYRQAALLARLSLTDFHAKRITVIRNTSSPYSDFLGTEFPKKAKEISKDVLISEFTIIDGFNDYKELVDRIAVTKPDVIFVPLTQAQIASLYVELSARDMSLVLLGSDTIEGKPQFLDLLGPKSKKIRFIYPKHWNERFEGPLANDYLSLQKAHCSQYEPSMASVAAYDAVTLLINAIKTNPNTRGEKLMKSIKAVKFTGMTGPIVYGADGDPIKPLELFEVSRGDAHHWKRYE